MRISDWSSDVCSSDVIDHQLLPVEGGMDEPVFDAADGLERPRRGIHVDREPVLRTVAGRPAGPLSGGLELVDLVARRTPTRVDLPAADLARGVRGMYTGAARIRRGRSGRPSPA